MSSPLMVDLTRTVYGAADRDPEDLLKFSDQPAIERHLIGAFLTAVYDQQFVRRATRPLVRYDAERAGAWLRFLADHTGKLGQPDIAWWQVERAISRATRGILAGLIFGLGTGLTEGFLLGLTYGIATGLAFGFGTGAVVIYGSARPPSRITVRFRGNGRSLLVRGIGGFSIGCSQMIVSRSLGNLLDGAVIGATLMVLRWLGEPPDVTTEATPADSLKEDRSAALVFSVVTCAALMLGALLLLSVTPPAEVRRFIISFESVIPIGKVLISATLGAGYGVILGGFIYGKGGAVAYGVSATLTFLFYQGNPLLLSTWTGLFIVAATMPVVIGSLGFVSRAWGAYTFARFYLALRGCLPWNLMRFLDDARSRGVLRQSGKVYQFRHERLREYLARTEEAESRAPAQAIPETAS